MVISQSVRSPMVGPMVAPHVPPMDLLEGMLQLPRPLYSPRTGPASSPRLSPVPLQPGPCSETEPVTLKRRKPEVPPGADLSPPKRARVSLRSAAGPGADANVGVARRPRDMSLHEAAERALRIFDELWANYLREYHASHEEDARKLAEQQVPAKYDELRSVVLNLLPRMSYTQKPRCGCPSSPSSECEYDVIEFQGRSLPPSALRRCSELSEQLAYARQASDEGRARDALLAALSALSSRSQECWLDAWLPEDDWLSRQKGEPKTKHQSIFEDWLKEALAEGARGHFVEALLHSAASFRIAFSIGEAVPRPASLLVTYSMPLSRCFEKMDGGGPLRGARSDWRLLPHFALQDIRTPPEGKTGTHNERKRASELRPEPAIRDLLRSSSPVIMLDAYAALAPRAECKAHGLGDIIKEELAKLFRDAKSRGQAVVFMLGGDDEHKLAQKVYLKAPFTDHGLRIGYLRWRETATEPWAREKRGDDRLCIGLQLP